MPDEISPERKDEVHSILRLAIAAAGTVDGEWQDRIVRLIPQIATAFDESSRFFKQTVNILDSPKIVGTIVQFEYHTASKRTKVHFKADRSRKDEVEHVWSARADEPLGVYQRELMADIPVGAKVLIWKDTEQIDDERKVRNMAHISRIDAGAVYPAAKPPPTPATAAEVGVEAPAQPPPPSPGEVAAAGSAAERMKTLSPRALALFVQDMRRKDKDFNPGNPEPWAAIVHPWFDEQL